ncbi:unnamed protein product, partial [Discosporangium mesarthrocarpum]
VCSARTKDIGVGSHIPRDLAQDSKIILNHVPTETQFADAFTEFLSRPRFQFLRSAL